MSILFLALIIIPPIHQLAYELRTTGKWQFLKLFREAPTSASLKRFEEGLGRDSILAKRVRIGYQSLMNQTLRQGTEKVLIGQDGFLFFRKEVDMAAGPGFLSQHRDVVRGFSDANALKRVKSDPVAVIIDYQQQLSERGIHLMVAPIPVKPVIYPEKVWPGYSTAAGPAHNRDYSQFLQRLRAAKVEVIDLTDDLWQAKSKAQLFLKQDTHWSPAGLAVVVQSLTAKLKAWLPAASGIVLESRKLSISNFGDLLTMLESEPKGNPFPKESVEITPILDGDNPVRGDNSAEILLLGDSFSNVYSHPDLGWGEGAGLGEQLMNSLGQRVQVIAQNGGGATGAREMLAQKPGALARKKIVLWTFSIRDLFDDSITWEKVPLPERQP